MFEHPVSISEILLILLVILLLFGGKKVPELARALGRSMSEFKKGQAEGIDEKEDKTKGGTAV
jgi:sec-independent protein translocase protein TatA